MEPWPCIDRWCHLDYKPRHASDGPLDSPSLAPKRPLTDRLAHRHDQAVAS